MQDNLLDIRLDVNMLGQLDTCALLWESKVTSLILVTLMMWVGSFVADAGCISLPWES